MNTSVGMKARKKQPSLSAGPAQKAEAPAWLKISLLSLETACMRILESDYSGAGQEPDRLYWQQRLMNITKPVSLALAECNGPRHFHNHYRHRKDDASILHPVLEDPVDVLAQVCRAALKACRSKLVGIQDNTLFKNRNMLEATLQGFLLQYEAHKPASK